MPGPDHKTSQTVWPLQNRPGTEITQPSSHLQHAAHSLLGLLLPTVHSRHLTSNMQHSLLGLLLPTVHSRHLTSNMQHTVCWVCCCQLFMCLFSWFPHLPPTYTNVALADVLRHISVSSNYLKTETTELQSCGYLRTKEAQR